MQNLNKTPPTTAVCAAKQISSGNEEASQDLARARCALKYIQANFT